MTQCMQSREHQYVFEPVCASVLLRRNTSKEPLRSRTCPRIEGHVQLESMSLRLSQVGEQPAALPARWASVLVPSRGLSVVVLGVAGPVPAGNEVPQRAGPSGERDAVPTVEAQGPRVQTVSRRSGSDPVHC